MTPRLAVLAVVAGALSIASPCVLPLLPAYLGVLSTSTRDRRRHRPTARAALGFVAGFSLVFVALGAVASAVGQLLRGRVDILTKMAGVAMIVIGLAVVAGTADVARTRLPAALAGAAQRVTTTSTIALGASVAIGWTPCIGPVLTSVLALSASTTTVYQGAAALALYSAGLAIPFLTLAAGLDHSRRLRRMVLRRHVTIERLGGLLLVAVGIGYLSGWWTAWWSGLQAWLARTGWPPL